MPADVALDGEVVRLQAQRIETLGVAGIGTAGPQRQLHVHGTEIHSSGAGAGLSFENREATTFVDTPKAGERWVLFATGGRARLWSGTDKLVVTPAGRVAIGHSDPRRQFHVHGDEVHSSGSGAGFSFGDRQLTSPFVESPTNGERWVWSASGGTARLSSGTDKLVVTAAGSVGVGTASPEARLHVEGTVRFSRSGVINIPGGSQTGTVNVADVSPDSLVFAVGRTLESMAPNGPDIVVRAARATAVGSIAVTLSAAVPAGSTFQVAWFALD